MYFIGPMHSAVNVASQDLMNVYGVDANAVSYMVSITNLLEIPAALVIGLVAGRRLSYRVCALLATALLPFVMCIFLLNPKNVPAVPQEDEKGEKVKIKLPVSGWVLLVLFLGTIIMSQSLFNLGGVSIGAVVGNPAVIGTVFSLFSVGAIASAVLFGPAYKFLSAYTIPVFWIIGLAGYVLWFVAHATGNVCCSTWPSSWRASARTP